MLLFYSPELTTQYKEFLLSEEESKHVVRVLRLIEGAIIQLVNGEGGFFTAEIIDAHPKRVTIRIVDAKENYQQLPYRLHIGIAPTKNMDRLEWFIEKATEVGIHEITPIISEHSERKEVKVDRLNKVGISAMKQSLKAYLPKINPTITLKEFLKNTKQQPEAQKAIAHCIDDSSKAYMNVLFAPSQEYIVLIGPEGDFSPAEVKAADNEGFRQVSLGDSRLRTETAALASVMEISLLNRR